MKTIEQYDVIIIGGGASGLVSAIMAAKSGASVLLLEKEKRLGRRLAATGNGACNLSHCGFKPIHFHGAPDYFIEPALRNLDEKGTKDFFSEMGLILTIDERKRYYPMSKSAGAVVDVLRFTAAELGVVIKTEWRVRAIQQDNLSFCIHEGEEHFLAKACVVACGGEAAPQLGGVRDGYELLAAFGHRLVPTKPGIVQLIAEKDVLRGMQGLQWQSQVTFADRSEVGEVLFTAYGLSGPPVLQLSADVSRQLTRADKVSLSIDFLPQWSKADLLELLVNRAQRLSARPLSDYFVGFLPRSLASQVIRHAKLGKQNQTVNVLNMTKCRQLAHTLKAFEVPIIGTRSFTDAQVTLGGIETADFDPETLMSWQTPGLFACGEVLDVDGECGGYNLQWAWSSGALAGRSAAMWALSLK